MKLRKKPVLESIRNTRYSLSGHMGRIIKNIIEQWLLPLPSANPAILEMFRDRDQEPYRDLLPWSGEFAGKYITGAVQVFRLTGDERLRKHLEWFVGELASLQAEDGYLGPWPKTFRLTGNAPNCSAAGKKRPTWDAWGHYHIMLGLLLWYGQSGDTQALECTKRIAQLLCNMFLNGGKRLVSTGSSEMNLAPIHALCLLYEITDKQQYLEMAHEIEKDFESSDAGDYIRAALAGKAFYQMSKPRWESLHPIQGIYELHCITGDERYRTAYENIWWSIAKADRHNTGGFSSGEQAKGNPYDQGPIETCCTIAWMALSVDMLRMTGNPVAADELELSMFNASIGAISPSGRWCTYNTPMDGYRKSFVNDYDFQVRPGSPELNCCSVNSARGLGTLSDWALMSDDNGIVLNYYGQCLIETQLASGNRVTLIQETDYPKSGTIKITVSSDKPESFYVKLRIPFWSKNTRLRVNGRKIHDIQSGKYLELAKESGKDDTWQLGLDMSLHFWAGENEYEGKTSIFRGPILLAFDPAYNESGFENVPELDAATMAAKSVNEIRWIKPWMLFEFFTEDEQKVRLCDFYSAGVTGNCYQTWMKVNNVEKTSFSRQNPLRTMRP